MGQTIIIICYLFFVTFILLYSLAQLNLAILYIKSKKGNKRREAPQIVTWPEVLIQLPIYNEKFVVERLLQSISKIDYDKEKLHIQILDDSTDETTDIISDVAKDLILQGFKLEHVRRQNRKDYKAGALQYGLETSSANFIAIFDADFTPKPNFLKETIPHFYDKKIGVVQTRWGHLNEDFSILTKLQSYVLNAHFTVDQAGRNFGNHFINFNGTAGIWRRSTIEDAGGWQGDTLTEDLDLSYRAQLKGWRFIYLEDHVAQAELPPEINALKTQQFRWAKGAAECSRKNLANVLASQSINFRTKLNAIFHLLNSFNWVCLMGSCFLLFPFASIIHGNAQLLGFLGFMFIYHLSFVALFAYYLVANRNVSLHKPIHYVKFIFSYPVFIALMMGLSLHNSIGVIEGYLGKKSSFVRTPKFNFTNAKKSFKGFSYVNFKFRFITFFELISIAYFTVTSFYLFDYGYYHGFSFSALMSIGLASVFTLSIVHSIRSNS